jgi:hypothetical protein
MARDRLMKERENRLIYPPFECSSSAIVVLLNWKKDRNVMVVKKEY